MTGTTKDFFLKIPVDVSVHVEQNLCISRWCCITDKVILLNYFDINFFFQDLPHKDKSFHSDEV